MTRLPAIDTGVLYSIYPTVAFLRPRFAPICDKGLALIFFEFEFGNTAALKGNLLAFDSFNAAGVARIVKQNAGGF
jgi:hypothetical protein